MIAFFTILNERSGMGNYFRMYQIYKILLGFVPVRFYVYTDDQYNEFIDDDVIPIVNNELFNIPTSDILVHDFPYLDENILQFFILNNIPKTVCLNDATVNELVPDIYFNADNIVELPVDVKSYLGMEYQIIRDDLIKKTGSIKRIQKIGIMFGGSDPGNLNLIFLNQINKDSFFSDYKLNFVVSKRHYAELSKLNLRDNINLFISPNIPEFYLDIDLLINMGGMSTYEAMFVGIPVCSIEWNYMTDYVRALNKQDLIINLGDIEKGNRNLKYILRNKSVNELNEMVRKSQYILDGQGAKRIAEKILEFLGE